MKFSHESPVSLLDTLSTDMEYQYGLVHLLEENEEYREWFVHGYRAKHGLGAEIYLDNSAFELGEAYNWDKYIQTFPLIHPNKVVVPDALGDAGETIENFKRFTKRAQGYYSLHGLKIGVVQGKTEDEAVDCYEFMSERADMIGIPFHLPFYQKMYQNANEKLKLTCQAVGRRNFIFDLLSDHTWNQDKPHHLLGCSLPGEMTYYRHIKNITSVDTSSPVMFGMLEKEYSAWPNEKPKQKMADLMDWEPAWPIFVERIKANIETFRKIYYGKVE